MTSGAAKKTIDCGWVSSGVRDAIRLGLSELPTIDPFQDIVSIIEINNSEIDFRTICNLSPEAKAIIFIQKTKKHTKKSMMIWNVGYPRWRMYLMSLMTKIVRLLLVSLERKILKKLL